MTRESEPVTPAQEAVTAAMLGGLIIAAAIAYIALRVVTRVNTMDIAVVTIAAFVFIGYVVPHVTAWWIGKPLDEIFNS